jgi:type IV secretion system protein VirB10
MIASLFAKGSKSASDPDVKVSAMSILGAARPPVTRYRPALLAGCGLIVGGVLAVALVIGLAPPHPKVRKEETTPVDGAAQKGPDFGTMAKSYGDVVGPLTEGPPLATLPTADPSSPAPTTSASPAATTPDEQQAQDLGRAARTAGLFFAGANGGEAGAESAKAPSPPPLDPAAALLAPATLGTAATQDASAATASAVAMHERFLASSSSGSDYVTAPYVRPRSPFEVKAGDIISAALLTELNSDLPGEIVAQVTEPVFDHASGRHILIPQGARLIGRYDSQVAYGQSRALIVWTRIIMPDGRSLDIGTMIGSDLGGASGLADRVDSHIGPLTRAIALSTAITVGGAIAQNASARSSGTLVLNDAAGGVASEASQAAGRFIDKDLNRAPTIRVRQGWPLTVLVSRDMVLEPY